ncbi:MAG: DUF4912 domain-containing protein [Spirochaetales bacterium]|nr:DUF4912 domain-containing protein [Spirochaetales bacterium]MCF7939642.1 DUF4912 domain-containing protein [Spirochaetales bacterium]
MFTNNLESLSLSELHTLADENGLEIEPGAEKADIVAAIQDAIEEDRIEQEAFQNQIVRIEGKKYDILNGDHLDFSEIDEYELPEHYNETKITLMLRDPAWAFAYWDISDNKRYELEHDPTFEGLMLRVNEKQETCLEECEPVNTFDISVDPEDSRWYINLPRIGNYYCIQLVCLIEGREEVLAESGCILTPAYSIELDEQQQEIDAPTEQLFSAVLDDEDAETDGIPQRIISLLDNEYLRLKS